MDKGSLARATAKSAVFGFLLATTVCADSAEIKVLAGSAIEPVVNEAVAQFEGSTGQKVVFEYGTIGSMAARAASGEAADVVIVSRAQLDSLEQQGRVLSGSGLDLAKTGVGIFVRKGAPKPDIGSVDAFKRAMLAAKSIGWNDPSAGAPVAIYMMGLFERLGLAEQMKPKTVVFKLRSERFAAVARGEVEIGFNQISEILAAPGVDLVGPLPADIQNYTRFAAGLLATGQNRDGGAALIRFISSTQIRALATSKGFEPP